MPITSFEQFQTEISKLMADMGADAEFAPHGNFWTSITYDQMINGTVPGVGGQPVKILVSGDSSQSAIIQSLRGEGLFTPGGRFRRMPAGGPHMTDEQIDEIATWIDANCPEHDPAPVPMT
jgi:hypothetical protein